MGVSLKTENEEPPQPLWPQPSISKSYTVTEKQAFIRFFPFTSRKPSCIMTTAEDLLFCSCRQPS